MDFFTKFHYIQGMKYPLKYIFQAEAQEILDLFTDIFRIRIAFFTAEGRELKVGKNKSLCRYCQLLRDHLNYESVCLTLDDRMRQVAAKSGKSVSYTCHGGMTESITPVIMDEVVIGFLMIGQFKSSSTPLPASINRQWLKQFGNHELQAAFEATPCYPDREAEHIVKLFNVLVDLILYRHMIEFYGNNSIQPLMRFMQTHMEENLVLAEGARILLQSKSSLAQKFKEATGKGFKRYQIDLKLDKADEYFRKHPEMTIREVAQRLGYQDQYYFSRLYKKYRGHSPLNTKKEFNR